MSDEQKKNLALDALQKIKEAEAEAGKIIQDAREKKSVKIIQDAYKEADDIKERLIAEARKQAQEKKKSIIQDAHIEVGKIKEETQAEIDRLRQISADTRTQAIVKVADRIRSAIQGGTL
jgi:vacuolar-type H+-ATPase subunit H